MQIEFGSRQVAIASFSAAVYGILNWISAAFQTVPGASLIFPATASAVIFGAWFGVWGVIGVIIGTIVSNPAWGTPFIVGVAAAFLANDMEALIPAVLFRFLRVDPRLTNLRSVIGHLVFGVGLNTAACSVIGMLIYVAVGWYTFDFAFLVGVWMWLVADSFAALVLGTPLLRVLSPYVMRTSLYHQGFLVRRKEKRQAQQ